MKKLVSVLISAIMFIMPMGAFAAAYDTDSPYATFDGVNLTGDIYGDDIVMNLVYQNDDGTNFAEYIVDSTIIVSYERLAVTQDAQGAENAVMQLLAAQDVTPTDFKIEPADDLSAQLGFTTYRLNYTIGANEDTCNAYDAYIQAGDWDYRFHTLTPADSYTNYVGSIDEWMLTLHLEDVDDMQFSTEAKADKYASFEMPLAVDQLELTDYEQYSDVEYEKWYSYDSGMVLLSYERYAPCENTDAAVIALTAGMYDSTANMTCALDDDISAQLGYPSYRIEYTTGENAEARQNVDIVTLLDDCTLCFHMEVSADMYSDYQQSMDGWISTLYIVPAQT